MKTRKVRTLIPGMETSDGAGVRLRRSLGQSQSVRLDPFLMLDEFSSENPDDYVAGFPDHPHRGFETVTYMLDGHMLHQDHLGNRGDLKSGGVQWMTAGRGIIHSEMPQQSEGRMRGFQLWINLPAAEKMKPAGYRDITPEEIPECRFEGGRAKVIAGELRIGGESVRGPMSGLTTDPQYYDLNLEAGSTVSLPIPESHNALVYVFEGALDIGGKQVPVHHAAVLDDGDALEAKADEEGARFLVLAGIPLGEPVVQYGPFVMNTTEEIEQALRDYRAGRLAQ